MVNDVIHNVIVLLPEKKSEVVAVEHKELNKYGYIHNKLALSNDVMLSAINFMQFNGHEALRDLYLWVIEDVGNINSKYNLTIRDRDNKPCMPIFGGLMVTGGTREGDIIGVSKEQEQILRRMFVRKNERLVFIPRNRQCILLDGENYVNPKYEAHTIFDSFEMAKYLPEYFKKTVVFG